MEAEPGDMQSLKEALTYCVLFELPSQRSAAASVWLKRICWVTLFGMRLQKTVNSPTQLRIIQHKQGRDGGNNKAGAHISPPQTTTHHPFSFLSLHPVIFTLSLSRPISSLSFFFSPPLLAKSPLSPSVHPSPPSLLPHLSTVVALVTIQRDFLRSSVTVATLGFPPGRCWKRATLRSAPAGLCWPPADRGETIGWKLYSSADVWRRRRYSKMEGLRLWNCWRFNVWTVCLDWSGFTLFQNYVLVLFHSGFG